MDDQTQPPRATARLACLWPWLIIAALLLFVGLIRVRLLDIPLERDEGEYAYAGQLLLQGIPPYELAYNMKLPGTYFAYALGMTLFGETAAGIHLTLILANALTVVFVFLLGRKLLGVTAGLGAAASYAVMTLSPGVMGLEAHASHFVVLFAVPGTLLLWKTGESDKMRPWFFSGLLYGLAFLMKQQGVCFCAFGGVWLLLLQFRSRTPVWRQFISRFFLYGLGVFLPFGLTCLYLARAGVFRQFWFWAFTYASTYAARLPPFPDGWNFLRLHLNQTLPISAGLWLAAIAGVLLALKNTPSRRAAGFMVLFWLFSCCGTAIGFYFRSHYFILLLPAFALLIGLGVAGISRRLKKRRLSLAPVVCLISILGWGVYYQKHFFFRLTSGQVSRIVYGNNPFVESVEAARYIREHSSPHARIAVLGSEPEIYFYARRHSATGYIYVYPLMEKQPYAAQMQAQMIGEIEAARPEYLVLVNVGYSWLAPPGADEGMRRWFAHYSGQFYNPAAVMVSKPDGGAAFHLVDNETRQPPSGRWLMEIYRRNGGAATPAR